MDKGLEQTLLQGRHTEGPETYEKMLSITTIREMQIKTTMRYHLTPVRVKQTLMNANVNFPYSPIPGVTQRGLKFSSFHPVLGFPDRRVRSSQEIWWKSNPITCEHCVLFWSLMSCSPFSAATHFSATTSYLLLFNHVLILLVWTCPFQIHHMYLENSCITAPLDYHPIVFVKDKINV